MLTAVEWLHQRGILHRDLKPENILLNEKMSILITDFGSAKLLPQGQDGMVEEDGGEPLPKRKSFVGTAQYVSPEILSGRASTRASDLWAIGCILYQMLTGMPPFQSQSEYLIFQKIQKLEYSFHEGFNEHARHLIQSLLVIEPTDRLGAKDKVRRAQEWNGKLAWLASHLPPHFSDSLHLHPGAPFLRGHGL